MSKEVKYLITQDAHAKFAEQKRYRQGRNSAGF
jgi:hypothetical protein